MPAVKEYSLKWDCQQHTGTVHVRIEGGARPIKLPMSKAEEFLVAAHLLALPGVQYDETSGRLVTDRLPTA